MRFGLAFMSLAAALALSTGAGGATGIPPCARGFNTKAPAGLPAPVVLQTRCAAFTVNGDGSVAIDSLPSPARVPKGFLDGLGDGAWLGARRHHLLIVRDDRVVWSSGKRYENPREVWGVLSPRAFAFSYRRKLYVTRLDGLERRVARAEDPIGWSPRGELYTYRPRHNVLRLRTETGRLLGRIARRVTSFRFEWETKTLLYVAKTGQLFRAEGSQRRKLADLVALGFRPKDAWIGLPVEPGMIGVLGKRQAAVLQHDGSLFGKVNFAVSWMWASADGHAVALGADWSIYVMEAGREPLRVYRSLVPLEGCGYGAEVAWHDDWLLVHAYDEANVVALDTSARARPVDLTAFARVLPGNETSDDEEVVLQARWVDQARRRVTLAASAISRTSSPISS